MTRLAVALLVLLALPATAAHAKGGSHDIHLTWLTMPDGTKAGGTWNARFSLDDPGGNRLLLDGASPEVRLVAADHSETTFPAKPDGNGYYEATVEFPSAGTYTVEAVGFDPRDPSRFIDIGPPVVIDPAASTTTRAPSDDGFPWALLAIAALALLAAVAARRFVRPASRTAR